MRVTTKGQVTIPRKVREILGIAPETDIDFQEENGRFYIVKTSKNKPTKKFAKLRGIATAKMSTKEIMNLTRKYNGVIIIYARRMTNRTESIISSIFGVNGICEPGLVRKITSRQTKFTVTCCFAMS